MSIIAIVQARMGSTRLPGKVMKDLAGKPMLLRVLNRISAASSLQKIVVAIPDLPESNVIEKLCAATGYTCFKGSEQDLLDRYYRTAVAHCADTVVRITADCPLIDPGLIDTVVQRYLQCPSALKYASNIHPTRTYPRGLDTEVFGFDTLESAWRNDRNQAWREHVTPFIYRHPEKYEIIGVTNPEDFSDYRLTVDTPEDFQLIELLYQWFNEKPFNWLDIVNLLREKPDWSRMNSAIEQKGDRIVLPGTLLICRADADLEICTGHVMRAIALGEAWRRAGGKAVLLTKSEPWLQKRAANSFAEVYSLRDKRDFAETMNALESVKKRYASENLWISLDGYHFDDNYQISIKEFGHSLLVFDDYAHLPHYSADIILNQNAGAELLSYHTNHSKLLLGTDYVMLRDEFLYVTPVHKNANGHQNILLTMGGVDAPNATQIVLESLTDIKSNPSIRVLIGRANPHRESLERFIADNMNHAELIVQADNMSELYQWSNMAIAAAGTTSWELCYFGVPSLLVQIADNQRALATHLAQTGAAINLGWFGELNIQELKHKINGFINDKALRSRMSTQAKRLVDGQGGVRLIREMTQMSDAISRIKAGREEALT